MLCTLLLTLLASAAQAIPPAQFGFPSSPADNTELSVAFTFEGKTTVVQTGQLFGGNITSQAPSLALNPARLKSPTYLDGRFVLIMVDPDAPRPEQPTRRFVLHWLGANFTLQGFDAPAPQRGRALTNTSAALQPYRAPMPPLDSSPHRYIAYLYPQPADLIIPQGWQTQPFDLDRFVTGAGLGQPVAAQYFYVSRQAAVPGTFVAPAGAQYPGGNGQAIFAASGNATLPPALVPVAVAASPSPALAASVVAAGLVTLALL